MITLKEPTEPAGKSGVVRNILDALPEWFGIPESVNEYVREAAGLPMAVICGGENPVGFVTLSSPSPDACEIHSMGILKEWQGQGGGKLLVDWAVSHTRNAGKTLLVVKTLSPEANYLPYLKTHRFYRSCGFCEVGVYRQIWGDVDPCLIMVRTVSGKDTIND
jgi:GNAT superfamily N-acetyltransferase